MYYDFKKQILINILFLHEENKIKWINGTWTHEGLMIIASQDLVN